MKIVLLMFSDAARENLVKVEKVLGLPDGCDKVGEGRVEGILSEGVLDPQSDQPLYYRIERMNETNIPRNPPSNWAKAIGGGLR